MAITKSHTRSISLPSRSHPTTVQIEEQIGKINPCEPTAESISNGLCLLAELYKSMEDFLSLPQTLQSLSKYQNAKWVDEILECPLTFLDICSITKDVTSQLKERVRELQSSLRRKKGYSSIGASIIKYTSFRNKMKKDVKRCVATLRKMNEVMGTSILDVDQEVSCMIRVVRKVNALTISIFQSVLGFFSKTKSSKWTFSRLLVNKSRVSCEGQQVYLNELEVVDNAISQSSSTMQEDLKKVEASIEEIEEELEGMSRCLIRSRCLILNVISC